MEYPNTWWCIMISPAPPQKKTPLNPPFSGTPMFTVWPDNLFAICSVVLYHWKKITCNFKSWSEIIKKCKLVGINSLQKNRKPRSTDTHTQIYIYIYTLLYSVNIYVYIYIYIYCLYLYKVCLTDRFDCVVKNQNTSVKRNCLMMLSSGHWEPGLWHLFLQHPGLLHKKKVWRHVSSWTYRDATEAATTFEACRAVH